MHKIFLVVMMIIVVGLGGYWAWSESKTSTTSTGTPVVVESTPVSSTVTVLPAPTPSTVPTNNSSTSLPINNKQIMEATLHTTKGDIQIEFSKDTPKTVANFVKLAQSGFYDGVKFHRVIKDFMIQSGDPLSKDDSAKNRWGTGGPGYSFNDEITANNHNDVGTIAMANSGPNTNGSQFFINANANNFLDTKHTVFGMVTKGLDVVELIDNVPTNPANDQPVDPVIIQSITLK